jgi:4'-phosphopantetheinyl transferase
MSKTPEGKPILVGNHVLEFNLSRSGGLTLLAVSRGIKLGIDVELVRQDLDVDSVAARFLPAHEALLIRESLSFEKYATFFKYWTRMEAGAKCDGHGLGRSGSRAQFECVSFTLQQSFQGTLAHTGARPVFRFLEHRIQAPV